MSHNETSRRASGWANVNGATDRSVGLSGKQSSTRSMVRDFDDALRENYKYL